MRLKIRIINSQKSKYEIQFEPNTFVKELSEGEDMVIEVEKRGDTEPLNILIDTGKLVFDESDDIFLKEV